MVAHRALVLSTLCGLAFLINLSVLHATTPYRPIASDPVLDPWRWRAFPELDGQGIQCMAEASDGAIWFGVTDGVQRYDGIRWTTYTPADGLIGAPVVALCATRDGDLYAGTHLGISQFKNGAWTRVFPERESVPFQISALREAAGGSLWAASIWGGLHITENGQTLYTWESARQALRPLLPGLKYRIVPENIVPLRALDVGIGAWVSGGLEPLRLNPIPPVILDMASGGPADRTGLQIGDQLLNIASRSALSGKPETPIALKIKRQGVSEPFEMSIVREPATQKAREFSIHAILEDRQGQIWFGLEEGEIVSYNPIQNTWQRHDQSHGLGVGFSPRIIQAQDGAIWAISNDSQKGVNRFDGAAWNHVELVDQGISNNQTSIIETRDGAIWIGGLDLAAYRNGAWTLYSEHQLPGRFGRKLLMQTSDGALWIAGYGEGVYRLDYGTETWHTWKNLVFQCETADGASWFISREGDIIYFDGTNWTREENGVIDTPTRLFATRDTTVWAIGSHNGVAATSRFDGQTWIRNIHPKLSWGLDDRVICETAAGEVWFSASVNRISESGQMGGLLRFTPASRSATGKPEWTHFAPPETPTSAYGIAQTADGTLWIGGVGGLRYLHNQTWEFPERETLKATPCDALYSTDAGELWVGTRKYGVFALREGKWIQYGMQDGLPDNKVKSIGQHQNGLVLVATTTGLSGFDGTSWSPYPFPDLNPGKHPEVNLRAIRPTNTSALWFNFGTDYWYDRVRKNAPRGVLSVFTIRYQPNTDPPETEITVSMDRVAQPGNTFISWKGTDRWHSTRDSDLQYAYRLDEGVWSPYTPETNAVFFSLPSGDHLFEVRARDRDFNVDPTPDRLFFYVVPPIWQQSWFLGLIALLLAGIGLQTWRVIRRDRRLQIANATLEKRVEERTLNLARSQSALQDQNAQQRALLRISQAIQVIFKPEDLNDFMRVCLAELKNLGLNIQTLGIHRMVDTQNNILISTHIGSEGIIWGPIRRTKAVVPVRRWRNQELAYCTNLDQQAQVQERNPEKYLGEFRQSRFGGIHIQSMLDVPFSDGLFCVHSVEEAAFSDADIEIVKRVAEMLAVGIARVKDLEQLENRESLLAQSQELAQSGSWEYETDTDILSLSDEFYQIHGLTPEQFSARRRGYASCIHTDDRKKVLRDFRNNMQSETEVTGYEYRIVRPDGAIRVLRGALKSVAEQGRVVRVYGIVQDVTEYKTMERELIHLERLRAAGELSAGVSHNLNNILTAVILPAQMLKAQMTDPEQREHIEMIAEASNRAKDLVHRLHLSTQGVEEKRLEPVDVNKIIQEAIQATRPRWRDEPASNNIIIDIAASLNDVDPVMGTETQLLDVFINFILNAVDAMPDGGQIAIATQQMEEQVKITVRDTGIGMDEDIQVRVFEPFFTTKANVGTGLGLSTVYRTITRWGGKIDIASAPGAGTTFTIVLPSREQQTSDDQKGGEGQREEISEGHILIVDDDEMVRSILQRLLQNKHAVETAENGQICLEKTGQKTYDAVFVDLGLPDLRGDIVAQRLKEKDPTIVTILITGWEADNIDIDNARFDFSLQKPFADMDAIVDLANRAVKIHRSRTET